MAEKAEAEEELEEEKDPRDENEEEEEATEEGEGEDQGGGTGKPRTILIVALLVTIGIGVGSGSVYFLLSPSSGGEEEATEEVAESDDDEEEEKEEEEEIPATPYYFSLDPAFVVNFTGKSRAKFLQVNIDGMTRDGQIKEDITTHLPQIRSHIILLLSSKTYEDLNTPEGKEDLRKEILAVIKKILRKETGKSEIEDVYFTSFVMQ